MRKLCTPFIAATVCFSALLPLANAEVGQRLPSEKTTVSDAVTNLPLAVLTNGKVSDAKIYQTHPQWTADGKYIIFRTSGRGAGAQAYAVNEETGDIIQVTDGPGNNTGTLNIARKSMKLYFLRSQPIPSDASETPPAAPAVVEQAKGNPRANRGPSSVVEIDLAKLLADSAAGKMKPAAEYERVCGTLPSGMRESGGFGLDADEKIAYLGVRGGDTGKHLAAGVEVQGIPEGARMGAGPAGLRSMNLETGEIKVVIDTPFQMGHVQTNPFVPGEIIYCHETGGKAPQRMWTVKADGTGNRPLFPEQPEDWVTHEAVITKDEVMFNLLGHQQRLRSRPTGIAVINLRSNAVQLLGQLDEATAERARPGGFWHCNGSHDGRWAVGDTFSGNIWLIDRRDGQMKLLSTDHKMKPDHCHPTFDETGTKILIQSGHFTNGERLSLVVIPVPAEMLAKK